MNTDTLLCDLPDSAFVFGGEISDMIRAAGYLDGATIVINQLHAWSWTVGDLLDYLA